jgi:ribosomal 50S subunit-recycling heat shock protein
VPCRFALLFALMRLDLFLKVSRLCPRRTIARQLCDAGFVFLNGRPAKSAHPVKSGDEITIRRRDRELVARVIEAPATRNVSRPAAGNLIEIVSERVIDLLED